jgi:xylulokinase
MQYVIAYDLGTGGLKAGLYQVDGQPAAFEFMPYPTYYPETDQHEQRPLDWWQAVCKATQKIIRSNGIDANQIVAAAASGHSLVAAPIGENGELLLDNVPIWSDRRATEETAAFFKRVNYQQWYQTTGNGDPPETYTVFKLLWLKKHFPEIYAKTRSVLGSKDFINFRFTGNIATDYSYASGSGVFDLEKWQYNDQYIYSSGISRNLFLAPLESHSLVGTVTAGAAKECGLCAGTKVFCGGVDNSCMALGTTGVGRDRMYTSLGSSAWIAVTSEKPILDSEKLPFVFAHVEKGFYTTGVSIFAAASAYKWARDTFCSDLSGDKYINMNSLAAMSPVGANGIMFNPSLAGGSSQEPSEALQGGFFGLKLSDNRNDMLRAILEGVALSLRGCLEFIDPLAHSDSPMIICGGGSKSDLWMQIFADVFDKKIQISNVDQDAASLGAAAIALRGAGFWKDYSPLDQLSTVKRSFDPIPENRDMYVLILKRFTRWINALATLHDEMIENYTNEWRKSQ